MKWQIVKDENTGGYYVQTVRESGVVSCLAYCFTRWGAERVAKRARAAYVASKGRVDILGKPILAEYCE